MCWWAFTNPHYNNNNINNNQDLNIIFGIWIGYSFFPLSSVSRKICGENRIKVTKRKICSQSVHLELVNIKTKINETAKHNKNFIESEQNFFRYFHSFTFLEETEWNIYCETRARPSGETNEWWNIISIILQLLICFICQERKNNHNHDEAW